jgi:hypothetical protein
MAVENGDIGMLKSLGIKVRHSHSRRVRGDLLLVPRLDKSHSSHHGQTRHNLYIKVRQASVFASRSDKPHYCHLDNTS